jgi:hypothetical protein
MSFLSNLSKFFRASASSGAGAGEAGLSPWRLGLAAGLMQLGGDDDAAANVMAMNQARIARAQDEAARAAQAEQTRAFWLGGGGPQPRPLTPLRPPGRGRFMRPIA